MLKLLRGAALLGVLAVGRPAQAIGLEAHLGLAVTFWNFNSGTTGDGAILNFDSSVDPFVMRVLEIRIRDLFGLEIGANYLTSKLLGFAGFGSEQDFAGKDPVSSVIGGNVSYYIGPVRLGFMSSWKRFEGSRTFTGAFLGGAAQYLPEDGSAQVPLQVGEAAKWSTAANDLSVTVGVNIYKLSSDEDTPSNDGFVGYVGYHRFSYSAPVSIDIFQAGGTAFSEVLMGTSLSSNMLELGLLYESTATPEDNWGFTFRLPVTIGQTSIDNAYLSGAGGLTMGLNIDASASYADRIGPIVFAIRAGLFATLFTTSSTIIEDVDAVKVKRAINTPDASFAEGTPVTFSTDREETFWGPYLALDVRFF